MVSGHTYYRNSTLATCLPIKFNDTNRSRNKEGREGGGGLQLDLDIFHFELGGEPCEATFSSVSSIHLDGKNLKRLGVSEEKLTLTTFLFQRISTKWVYSIRQLENVHISYCTTRQCKLT